MPINTPQIPQTAKAIEKGKPLKFILDEVAIGCLAKNIACVYANFKQNAFIQQALLGLDDLALMDRAKHIASALIWIPNFAERLNTLLKKCFA